ncbi:MAG: ABC transporter permease [Candidatus Acidiferrales bacterium]
MKWPWAKRDEELDEEIRAHIEMSALEREERGATADEARAAARREFGNVSLVKETTRDVWGWTWLERLWQDVRYGLRMMRRNPGFTAVAVLTLALGIGANTAIFSLIDALFLRSLPVRDPQELVLLKWSAHKSPKFYSSGSSGDCLIAMRDDYVGNPAVCSFSHPFFDEVRAQSGIFLNVAASGGNLQLDLSGIGPASIMRALIVSGNYFDTLGVRPAIGRMIEPSDEDPAATPVAVLGYGYWQRVFGGSFAVVGKTVGLNGVPTTIVGVAERRFAALTPGSDPDAWLPLSLRPRLSTRWNAKAEGAASIYLLIIGRLKPGVPRGEAQAAVSLLFHNEMIRGAQPLSEEADAPAVSLVPAQTGLNGGARAQYSVALFTLMFAVGIVLLIACANVAGLLVARSATRQKEMAVRLALGAGRGRIVRQLLTESVLLSVFGGALGTLVAIWGARIILALLAGGSTRPLGFNASVDTRVLLFTAGIALTTGIVFGLAPAMRGTRVDLTPALKDGGNSLGGARRARNRRFNIGNSLVVGQIALAMIVLVGAGLLVRTLQNLRDIDPGFDISNVLNFSIDPTLVGYKGTQVDALYRNLQGRLGSIPGVTSVSYSSGTLLSGGLMATSFHIASAPEKSSVSSDILPVGPNFFATMKFSLLSGRDFSQADFVLASAAAAASAAALAAPPSPAAGSTSAAPSAPTAAIVNQTFARRYLGGVDPLGQRFGNSAGGGQNDNGPGYVVIGVVRDAKYDSLRREISPTAYVPATGGGASFEMRTAVDPTSIIPAVQSVVNQADRSLPIFGIITESQSVDQLLFQERLIARLSSFFGILALMLACVGLYGLLSYEVTRRTREIGIRMALGAGQRDVLSMVVKEGLVLTVTGVVVGIAAAFGVTRYLGSILYDVHPGDPATLMVVAAILLLVALLACYIPARRATRVDPMVALRYE